MADAVESVESVEEMMKQIMQTQRVRDKFYSKLEEIQENCYLAILSLHKSLLKPMGGDTSAVPIPKPRQECPDPCDRGRGGDESWIDNGESGGELRYCAPKYLVST